LLEKKGHERVKTSFLKHLFRTLICSSYHVCALIIIPAYNFYYFYFR